jgi:plasmid stabilization system protein ParE
MTDSAAPLDAIELAPEAERDLTTTLDWLAERNPAAAVALHEAVAQILTTGVLRVLRIYHHARLPLE